MPATSMSTIVPRTCSSGSFSPFDLDVQQIAREVVAGVRDVVLDLRVEVLGHGLEHRAALLGREVDEVEHQVHEVAKEVLVLFGEAQHRGDDARRDVLRVLARPRRRPRSSAERVEVLVAERADLGLERVDRPGREGGQDEAPRELVKGRVRGDRRRAPDGRDGVRRELVVA